MAIELAIYGEEAQKDVVAQLINRRIPAAAVVGGAAVGGAVVGGAAVGGAVVGGAAVGGAFEGGGAVGGAVEGGGAVGGAVVGGAAVGGAVEGGGAVGGAVVGGAAVGGAVVGGAAVEANALGVGVPALGAVHGVAANGLVGGRQLDGDVDNLIGTAAVDESTTSANRNHTSSANNRLVQFDDRSQNSDSGDDAEGSYGPRLSINFMNRVMLGKDCLLIFCALCNSLQQITFRAHFFGTMSVMYHWSLQTTHHLHSRCPPIQNHHRITLRVLLAEMKQWKCYYAFYL